MANLKRLTDRVSKMEKWLDDNNDGDTVANMHYLIRSVRQASEMLQNEQNRFQELRGLLFEFLKSKGMETEWDEYLKDRENAVQEQETEEISVQEQTEDSEEVIEEEE